MSKGTKIRQAVQLLVCRAVLSKHLQGDVLEEALKQLRAEMRTGPNAWAFKKADPENADDRVYYESGGNI
jgi:hypothetical protein